MKGKDWLRLRVGFFSDVKEAKAVSKDIMSVAGVDDAWVIKVSEEEIRNHCF